MEVATSNKEFNKVFNYWLNTEGTLDNISTNYPASLLNGVDNDTALNTLKRGMTLKFAAAYCISSTLIKTAIRAERLDLLTILFQASKTSWEALTQYDKTMKSLVESALYVAFQAKKIDTINYLFAANIKIDDIVINNLFTIILEYREKNKEIDTQLLKKLINQYKDNTAALSRALDDAANSDRWDICETLLDHKIKFGTEPTYRTLKMLFGMKLIDIKKFPEKYEHVFHHALLRYLNRSRKKTAYDYLTECPEWQHQYVMKLIG